MKLSRDDLVEIRTLMSIGWGPQKIFEFRVANEYRQERDLRLSTIKDACAKIKRTKSIEREPGSGRPPVVEPR